MQFAGLPAQMVDLASGCLCESERYRVTDDRISLGFAIALSANALEVRLALQRTDASAIHLEVVRLKLRI